MNDGSVQGGMEVGPGVWVRADGVRWGVARSGGPGGQNVNKVNTKVELWVRVDALMGLHPEAVERLVGMAGRHLTAAGELHFTGQSERSQEGNRREVMERLRELVVAAKKRPKVRKRTKPSRAARERRLAGKKRRGEVKAGRRGVGE